MIWSSYLFQFGIILLAILPFIWTIRNSNFVLHAAAAGPAWYFFLLFILTFLSVAANEVGLPAVIMNSQDPRTVVTILLPLGMIALAVLEVLPIILFSKYFPQLRQITPKLAAPFIAGIEVARITESILGGAHAGSASAISVPEVAFVGSVAAAVLVGLGAVKSVRAGLIVAILVAGLQIGLQVVTKQIYGGAETIWQAAVLQLSWSAALYTLALILHRRHEYKNGPAKTADP